MVWSTSNEPQTMFVITTAPIVRACVVRYSWKRDPCTFSLGREDRYRKCLPSGMISDFVQLLPTIVFEPLDSWTLQDISELLRPRDGASEWSKDKTLSLAGINIMMAPLHVEAQMLTNDYVGPRFFVQLWYTVPQIDFMMLLVLIQAHIVAETLKTRLRFQIFLKFPAVSGPRYPQP